MSTPHRNTPRVALIGANGHGQWHRRRIAGLVADGRVDLVALCDVAPISDLPEAPVPPGARIFADHRELLRDVAPDVVVICTPPHTHLVIATDAARAGADLLLEKPPVVTRREHEALVGVLAETGRACQIGFQALGSAGLARLREAIGSGRLGTLTGVSAVCSWQRPDSYYTRARWAGRRWLDAHPVLDGALENPFAHALMQCLAIAGSAPVRMELEAVRTRPIETDDTACLRVTLASGVTILVAVTLCGEEFLPGEITVHGTGGRATLEYPTDRLALPGDAEPSTVERVGLLENLLDHRREPTAVPLLVPLSRTASFTAVIDLVRNGPAPPLIGAPHVKIDGDTRMIPGVNEVLTRAGAELALPSELGVDWAVTPWVEEVLT